MTASLNTDWPVAVVGGGAWGTALACAARRAGNPVTLLARNPETVADITAGRGNPARLPGVALAAGIRATTDAAEALTGAAVVLMVVPAQQMRQTAVRVRPLCGAAPVAICAKGMEQGSGALMHELAAEFWPQASIALLSGPNFAAEVARGFPAAATVASTSTATQQAVRRAVGSKNFRLYLDDDLIGVAVGGTVKNVLAIACGITIGRELGENARAALITRGLAEMARLSLALGGRAETMTGLAGLGDLLLTCGSPQSRNTAFGIALGQGKSVGQILASQQAVTEGVWSSHAVSALAEKLGVDMPICATVHQILHQGLGVEAAIEAILNRAFREERE